MTSNLQFFITKPRSHLNSKNKARKSVNNIVKAYDQAEGLLSIM